MVSRCDDYYPSLMKSNLKEDNVTMKKIYAVIYVHVFVDSIYFTVKQKDQLICLLFSRERQNKRTLVRYLWMCVVYFSLHFYFSYISVILPRSSQDILSRVKDPFVTWVSSFFFFLTRQ